MKKVNENKTIKKAAKAKTTAKKQSTALVVVKQPQIEDKSPLQLYKESMIKASKNYIARRLAAEGKKINAAKKREILGLDLSKCLNATFELLQKAGATPDCLNNLRLCCYAKSLSRTSDILNAIATGAYKGNYNCLAGSLIDLKRACKQSGFYLKKELSFSTNGIGKTGGANPAGCMLGVTVDTFGLGTFDKQLKVMRLKPFVAELIAKMSIESPKFLNKD